MKKIWLAISVALVMLGLSSMSFATTTMNQNRPHLSVQQKINMHQDLARIHQKAAGCLKSHPKAAKMCQKQFRSNLQMVMNKYGVKWHHKGHMKKAMHQKMHDGQMNQPASQDNSAAPAQSGQQPAQQQPAQ